MTESGSGPHLPSVGGFRSERPARPVPTPPPVQPNEHFVPLVADLATMDVMCRRCAFNLRGLTPEKNCPECGYPIRYSIAVDHLIYSSPDYLRKLSQGLAWVLIVTILQFVIGIGSAIVVVIFSINAASTGTPVPPQWQLIGTLLSVPLTFGLLYGWWLFSEPDPGVASTQQGQTPRRIVRWATVINVGISVVSAFAVIGALMSTVMAITMSGISIISLIAGLFQFFASLLYVKWLATRMHDRKLADAAARNLWLLPLIYILGLCLLGLGPLIAIILYLVMLNELRTKINAIRARQQREFPDDILPA